ncbi:MAG TPA: MFS transporter [Chloroflexota bacterium]
MIAAPRRTTRALTLTGYLSFVLLGSNAVLVPALIRSIEHDFHQSDAALGIFYFISSVVYAVGSFSGGFLTERFGRRRILSLAAFLFGLGLLVTAAAPVWAGILLAAVAVNWGAGSIDGGVNGLFLDLYQEARGGALNLLHFFFGAGALIAPFAVGLLVAAGVSWRVSVLGVGVGILVLVVLLRGLEMPSGRRVHAESDGTSYEGVERSLLPFIGLAIAIGCYVAGEMAVSAWLVKYLSSVSVTTATGVLSVFWGGLALGRLVSNRIAERLAYVLFTVLCIAGASISLVAALLTPIFPLAVILFGLTGLFNGPIYPMIVAIGGNLYPHRIAALSGSLAAAAVVGSFIYPPAIGLLASRIGLRAGLLGAAALGIPAALAIVGARVAAGRGSSSAEQPESSIEAAL